MATHSRTTGFPEFVDAKSGESVRRRFIEAPAEVALQSGLGPAFQLAKLLSLLPDAFADSQRRELERIKPTAEENDPRVAALETSIEQADSLRRMARLGEVRAQRSLTAQVGRNAVFHGFVSDSDLNPLKGLTVQVTPGSAASDRRLSDTTGDDGYFCIHLGKTSDTRRGSEKDPANITPEQIAELFARKEKERETKEQVNNDKGEGRVEILKKGKLLYEDPVPIGLDDGSAYREYVIGDKESPASDSREFASKQRSRPASPGVDSKEDATKGSEGSSTASPPARRTATKETARRVKSTKPASKK